MKMGFGPCAGLALAFTLTATVAQSEEAADWWDVQREISGTLTTGRVDFVQLAGQVTATPPATPRAALLKVAVAMRGGLEKEASEALRELKARAPNLPSDQVQSIYYYATDRLQNWDLARETVEVFAENIRELALENRLLKHDAKAGRSVEQIDAWLARMPPGLDGFWTKERLRFNMAHGRGGALLAELEAKVRGKPSDVAGAIAYLDALLYARSGKEQWDLAWLPGVVAGCSATQAANLAERLRNLQQWAPAEVYYARAIETPLTDEEVGRLATRCQMEMPPERTRAMFATQVREGRSACLLELGRKEDAQRWMVEADDLRKQQGLGRNALFAGRVQQASGQPVVEGRIREQEKKSEDDPAYWRERASYYRGRKDAAQEEAALRRGLALTAPAPPPTRASKGGGDMRNWMLNDLAMFLGRNGRDAEAAELLRMELAEAPADSASAAGAAYRLAFDFEKFVRVDDEVLWTWLAVRPTWSNGEERLLWRMLENAPRDALEAPFARAEKLAAAGDASRAYELGWILNRMGFPKRSLPLLERALAQATDDETRERAAFALFESCLDTGNWRRGEEVYPLSSLRLTFDEGPEWLGRLAVCAARAGAADDAVRIWKEVLNLNPSERRGLDDLARAGLADRLAEVYRQWQRALPGSNVTRLALRELGRD